jgi:IclR family acetate operon transcriptional repressor
MLAHLPDPRPLLKRTAARLSGRHRFKVEALVRQLAQVRSDGYAVLSLNPGVISIAAPVMAHDGRAAAALSVSAPSERVSAKKKAAIIEGVLNASANMAERVSL